MDSKIEINQQALSVRERFSDNWIKKIALSAFLLMRKKSKRLSIALITPAQIKKINYIYLGRNRPTDVLAFPLAGDPVEKGEAPYWGEVIICPSLAKKQAKMYGLNYREEIARLIIHGILHLAGFSHETEIQARKMFAFTDKILKKVI